MKNRIHGFVMVGITLLPSAVAAADRPAFCSIEPGTASKPVNKDLVADSMLDAGGVTRALMRRVATYRAGLASNAGTQLTDAQALIVENLCAIEQLKCTAAEKGAVYTAGDAFNGLFHDPDNIAIIGSATAANYFTDANAGIWCKPPTTQPAVTTTANMANPFENLRIRGSATDLLYARTSAPFGDSSKAVLSFSNDDVKKKTATTFVAALGYAFLSDGETNAEEGVGEDRRKTKSRPVYGVIPYIAANVDTSRVTGKARDVSSNQLEIGAALVFMEDRLSNDVGGGHLNNYYTLTPRYVVNYEDDSAFIGANFLYRPTFLFNNSTFGLNRMMDVGISKLRWGVNFDSRINYGHFTRIGSRTGVRAEDFLRVGVRGGILVTNDAKGLPIDLSISDTWLGSISGNVGELNLFKSSLSVYFHEKKYFGMTLEFSRGRDSDFADTVSSWTLGLSVKY